MHVRLATIAVTLASYIRALGYGARAQVMPNYQVLTVPVAIDAGMGGLGRHGLMITKELGSALKLATVTTDLPMAFNQPRDIGVAEFCTTSGSTGPALSMAGLSPTARLTALRCVASMGCPQVRVGSPQVLPTCV